MKKDDEKELAARARGYRDACIDVLGYSFHDGEIGAAREVHQWIDEASRRELPFVRITPESDMRFPGWQIKQWLDTKIEK